MFKSVIRSNLYRRLYDKMFCIEALIVDPTLGNVNWGKAQQEGFWIPYRWVTMFTSDSFHVAEQFQKDFNNKHRLPSMHKSR